MDWVGLAWARYTCPTAPNGFGLGRWVRVSGQPRYLRGRARGSPQPCAPTAIHGKGPSVSTRDWRRVPLLWGRSPRQRGIRHRACRINTHPLYTSHCLSGMAAQSLFLNSLLYYTGQQIATACLLPCQGCHSPVRPGEQGVLHTARGPPLPGDGDGAHGGLWARTRSPPPPQAQVTVGAGKPGCLAGFALLRTSRWLRRHKGAAGCFVPLY